MITLPCCCYCTDRYGMSWCSAHLGISRSDVRLKEPLGTIFPRKGQKLVNWLLIYLQIYVNWNWSYHMDWDCRLRLFSQSLCMKVIWKNFISETIL